MAGKSTRRVIAGVPLALSAVVEGSRRDEIGEMTAIKNLKTIGSRTGGIFIKQKKGRAGGWGHRR
jgi:hypothetical protein